MAQPNPREYSTSVVVISKVMSDLASRAVMGEKKYGTLLKTHNGRKAIVDLYEELLDACMYVKQFIMETENETPDNPDNN